MLQEMRRQTLSLSGTSDPLVQGFLLAIDAWSYDAAAELCLEGWISSCLSPSALVPVVCRHVRFTVDVCQWSSAGDAETHFYHRLARLLDAIGPARSTPDELLRRIESFGQVSCWLKVAGDAKAEVLKDAIGRRPPGAGECTLELGAFVGYSAIRFAGQVLALRGSRDFCGVSLEIDPVHAAVSRHHLDRASLSGHAEIWVGQLQDTMSRTVEAFGWDSFAFIFMDQRGTTFHEDLAQLERLHALAASSQSTADNTVKPGSPIYLWHVVVGATDIFATSLWSVPEFALDTIEDWQAVSVVLGRRHIS